MHFRTILSLLTLACGLQSYADWTLDSTASHVSFVSIKAGNIAEVHSFGDLSGSISGAGAASIAISLDSVATLIPIRDERMRELLFRTADFPVAALDAELEPTVMGLPPGATVDVTVTATLSLTGARLTVPMDVTVARISPTRVLVTSRTPVIVNAGSVNLVAGVEKLREIAGLPSISHAVPVTFVAVFDQTG